jgi:hypothetical protein
MEIETFHSACCSVRQWLFSSSADTTEGEGMSDEPKKRTRLRVAALLLCGLAFAAVVEGVAMWLRAGTAPEVTGENAVNTDPTMTWDRFQKVSEAQARPGISKRLASGS